MNIATAQQDLAGRHADHGVIREDLFQNALGFAVGGGIQQRVNDAIVGDEEVHVGTGQTTFCLARHTGAALDAGRLFLGAVERARLGQLPHFQLATLGVDRRFQHLEGGHGALVLGIVLIVSPVQGHFTRAHEAAHVVDVAVGLVHVDALVQPDKALHAQIVAQVRFDLRFAQVRIAVFVEQALGGGQAGAFAVDVDGAPFQNERRVVAIHAVLCQHLGRHLLVLIPRVVETTLVAAPGVEAPIHPTALAGRVGDDGGAAVAGPAVIAVHFDQGDMGGHDGASLLHKLGRHPHKDRGGLPNGIRHLGEGGLREATGLTPVVRAKRPDHPDGLLVCPLGRHGEAVGGRRGVYGLDAHRKAPCMD